MAFKMKRTKATFPYKGESHDFVHEGDYKIVRKDLEEHQDEMEAEDEDGNKLLEYDDDSVTDRIAGKEYKRKDGKLIDNDTGKEYEEGDPSLPHEKRAFAMSNKIKNA